MSEQEREKLTELANRMREIASRVGSMHSYWDIIGDIDELLAGRRTYLDWTPAGLIQYCESTLNRKNEPAEPPK